MKITLIALMACLSIAAWADGLPIENGRYVGPVLVLSLTDAQKQVIAQFRACHVEHFKTMNVYTPYIFQLTHELPPFSRTHPMCVKMCFEVTNGEKNTQP